MRLVRGVYEGPQSYGILRTATSIRGVHTVFRALPGEAYFPTLYGTRERTGELAPVTLSPLREQPGDSMAPGNISRDLSGVLRRHPRAEIIVLARSEASLLSGEEVQVQSLPETGARSPDLVTFSWEAVGKKETEAAELALEDLIRAHENRTLPTGAPTPRSTSSGRRSSPPARRPSTPRQSGCWT